MRKSPCKKCEDHKIQFPTCINNCKKLHDVQQKHIRSYDYSVNYNYCENSPTNR